ncbi:MAG TPA: universal stress protein, partial [Coleofasciculaceae cyanobacterium]
LFRQVLLPYDGSDAAKQLVKQLNETVGQHSEHALEAVYLCWVVEDVGRRDIPREAYVKEAEKQLAQVGQQLKAANLLEVEYRLRLGTPVVEILEEAKDRGVSAIVVSSNISNRLVNWSVPSFTKDLFHRSWHPVIYIPPRR